MTDIPEDVMKLARRTYDALGRGSISDSERIALALMADRAAQAERIARLVNLPLDRETLGRMVREAWVRWAEAQPAPKPSWLVSYDELSEPDKEADRQIGETIAKWTVIHCEAIRALSQEGSEPS